MKFYLPITLATLLTFTLANLAFCQSVKLVDLKSTNCVTRTTSYGVSFKKEISRNILGTDTLLILKGSKDLQPIVNIWNDYLETKNINKLNYFKNILEDLNLSDTTNFINKIPKYKLKSILNFYLVLFKDSTIKLFADTSNTGILANCKLLNYNPYLIKGPTNLSQQISFKDIEMWDGSKIYKSNYEITIRINQLATDTNNISIINKALNRELLDFISRNYKIGKYNLKKNNFSIVCNLSITSNLYDYGDKTFQIFANNSVINDSAAFSNLKSGKNYKQGDTIFINNNFYKIGQLNTKCDKINIYTIPHSKIIGSSQHFYVPFITLKHLGDSNKLVTNFNDGKLKLLDFWGTWCIPCIKQMPKLKFFLDQNPKLDYYSILYDNPSERDRALKILHENKLPLKNAYFDNRETFLSNSSSVVKLLKISCYPGFVLINKNGKIIFRGCGEEGLESIKKIISEINLK